MTEVSETLTGIVLAGGDSQRFGGVDKMTQAYKGKPLFHHPLGVLEGICDEVIVQSRPGTQEPPLPETSVPVRVGHDPEQGQGPLVGLLAALRITWTPLALVVGGDMPDLSPRVLLSMIRVARDSEETEAVLLQEAGSLQPLPCVVRVTEVRAKAIELLRPSAGDVPGLRNLMAELSTTLIPDAEWKEFDAFGSTLRDIDRPEDLHI